MQVTAAANAIASARDDVRALASVAGASNHTAVTRSPPERTIRRTVRIGPARFSRATPAIRRASVAPALST
jgi:hypothetical protein